VDNSGLISVANSVGNLAGQLGVSTDSANMLRSHIDFIDFEAELKGLLALKGCSLCHWL